jgi:hypothetical protein
MLDVHLDTLVMSRRGDWKCICGHLVFGFRDECGRCHKRHPPTVNKNDWICPNCKYSVFASKKQCPKCNTNRDLVQLDGMQLGDWFCPKCQQVIYKNKAQCLKCHTTKEEGLGQKPPSDLEQKEAVPIQRSNDWICRTCKEVVFGTRSVCRTCGIRHEDGRWNCRKGMCNQINKATDEQCVNRSLSRHPNQNEDLLCTICFENPRVLINTCKHICICESCSKHLTKCPMCCQPFQPENIEKVYM